MKILTRIIYIVINLTALLLFTSCGGGDSSLPPVGEKAKFHTLKVVFSGNGGTGKITLKPSEKTCQNSCEETFPVDNKVKLIPQASVDSSFKGYGVGSDSDCLDGEVTMSADISCIAVFDINGDSAFYDLTITLAGLGTGALSSGDTGINCSKSSNATCTKRYIADASVTLTPAPATGNAFTGWSGDTECSANVTGNVTTVSMTKALNCTATFEPSSTDVTLTVKLIGTGSGSVISIPTSATGINCGAGGTKCDGLYTLNSSITLKAAPALKNNFLIWGADCGSNSSTATVETNITMSAAKTCTANFEPQTSVTLYNLGVSLAGPGAAGGRVTSVPNGIDCSAVACNKDFAANVPVTLIASELNATSKFKNWGGNCGTGTATSYIVPMTAATSCIANFDTVAPVTYQLTIQTNGGNGTGSVTSIPAGINCGATCSFSYSANKKVTLKPLATGTSVFSRWTGTGCTTGVVTMTANTTCTAVFTKTLVNYDLNVVVTGGSTTGNTVEFTTLPDLSCGPLCGTYKAGTDVTLNALPGSPNDTFINWTGACTGTNPTTIVRMSSAKTCTANFGTTGPTLYPLTMTVTSGSTTGTLAPLQTGTNCGPDCQSYVQGTVINVNATPASGYQLKSWGGSCSTGTGVGTTKGGIASVTIGTVSLNCTVTFEAVIAPLYDLVIISDVIAGSVKAIKPAIPVFDCGLGSCRQGYPDGTVITMEAISNPGYIFNGWGPNCGTNANTKLSTTTVTMSTLGVKCAANFTL